MICIWCGKEIQESERHKYLKPPYHMRCVGPAGSAQIRRIQANKLKQGHGKT